MRTTIDMDEALLTRLREDAHREGIPFRAMLHRVILRGLDSPVRAEEIEYAPPSFAMGRVREGINLVKALQLVGDLEDEERLRALERGR